MENEKVKDAAAKASQTTGKAPDHKGSDVRDFDFRTQNAVLTRRSPVKIGGYHLNLFSEEDHANYGEYLETIPYRKKLDKAFRRFNKVDTKREKLWNENVAGAISIEMEFLFPPTPPFDEDENIDDDLKKRLLRKFFSEDLTELQVKRMTLFFVNQLTLEEIAKLEGTSILGIWRTIERGLKKLKHKFREAGYEIPND